MTKCTTHNIRIAPKKLIKMADFVRAHYANDLQGLTVQLSLQQNKASDIVLKTLNSAIANAEHNHGSDVDDLSLKAIYVNSGPTLKRFKARAKGRGARILKRTSHLTIELTNEQAD
ncbi:MAG: 50S ribosomal protein L22 [Candidatus Comchoanobacterales bacterium]